MRCFTIGPIGPADSDTRKNADYLFDYVIKPVLESYNFDVVRADRISTVASITEEIISLIQNSELCIIDLTEANPNVFYEAGRRHETGKPYIHLLQEGQKPPFDVQGIRYLEYKDLSTTSNVFDAQSKLKSFLDVVAKTGFGASRSINPLNNIEEALRRIEGRLSSIVSASHHSTRASMESSAEPMNIFDPRQRIFAARESRQFRDADAALIDLDDIYVDKIEVVYVASDLAKYGRAVGAEISLKYLGDDAFLNELTGRYAADIYSALTHYYTVTGQAEAGRSIIYDLVDRISALPAFQDFTGEEKAICVNAAQRIAYESGDLTNASKYSDIVMEFEPEEPIWFMNATLVQRDRGDKIRAAALFDEGLAGLKQLDRPITPDWIETGIRLFHSLGQAAKVSSLMEMLRITSPKREAEMRTFINR